MKEFIKICKSYFGYAMIFSMFINILQLTFSIYMLQVYDRVLTSYNMSTLVVITIAAVVALITLALLESIRSRLLIRAGVEFDRNLSIPILNIELRSASGFTSNPDIGEIRDVQNLRNFLGSSAVFAFFDIPWMAIYFLLIFILHPMLGYVAVIGGCLVFCIGIFTQKYANPKLRKASDYNKRAVFLLNSSKRNAAVIKSMGMIGSITSRWDDLNNTVIKLQTGASRRVGFLHAISRSIRVGLQVAIYAVGAYLAITHQTTAGVMIAASIVMGRALAPLDQAMATYKQSLEAFSAYRKIKRTLENEKTVEKMLLPPPAGAVAAEALSFGMQGSLILQGVSFSLKPGTSLAIIGPSASGKSTLCKLLLGIWPPSNGKIRLDGADIGSWDSEKLGAYLGYLPQDVELFAGSIAENIARMQPVDSERIIRAAQMAGVHELILGLPNGYDTKIGEIGQGLSGGQRQRIGLARALYGEPKVIVLDEPNSNLDEEGEAHLMRSLSRLKEVKTTVILVAHKPSLLREVDEILVLQQGKTALYGPRVFVLQKMNEIQQKRKEAMVQRQEAFKRQAALEALDKRGSYESYIK